MSKLSYAFVAVLVLALGLPSWASVIIASDDVTFRGSTPYNNSDPFGLFARGGGDRAYVAFTLDNTPATSAFLNLYNAWNKDSSPVNRDVQITGGPGGFDETLVTEPEILGIEAGYVLTSPQDTFHVDNVPQWYALDITDFYNAHLGQTVSMAIRVIAGGGDGPIFADHEGTPMLGASIPFTGGPGFEPNINWVPEPASVLMLGAGCCLLLRRRRN